MADRLEQVDLRLLAWARWRVLHRSPGAHLGYKPSMLARALRDLPKTACPVLHARGHPGKVRDPAGQILNCPVCNGTGAVDPRTVSSKINPSFIRRTDGGSVSDNPAAEAVERAVTSLPGREREIILRHYCTHYHLPAYAHARFWGLSASWYSRLIQRIQSTIGTSIL